jgi:CheY-like chemotaxis protein
MFRFVLKSQSEPLSGAAQNAVPPGARHEPQLALARNKHSHYGHPFFQGGRSYRKVGGDSIVLGVMSGHSKKRLYRVLVVDDEESVRTLAGRVLSGAGYDVTPASDGPEALRIVEERGLFDLFVIDFSMPGMLGTEVAQRLRILYPDANILYCTGLVDGLFDEVHNLWQHEAFLEKPMSARGLLEAVALMIFDHTTAAAIPAA